MTEKKILCESCLGRPVTLFNGKHLCAHCAPPHRGFGPKQTEIPGTKNDKDKPRPSLTPWGVFVHVLDVLEHGAKKYEADNWKGLENGEIRYSDAAMRHLMAHLDGEYLDPDSGLPHLAHAACSCIFALWHHDHS